MAHAAPRVQSAHEAAILVAALSYDRELPSRAGKSVTIAIVYSAKSSASVAHKREMLGAFNALKSKIAGLPFTAREVAYEGAGALQQAIGSAGIDVVYVCAGLEDEIRTITEVTRAARVSSMSGERDNVVSGVSIGVTLRDDKPALVVNLPASKAEGLALSGDLMRLAEIIR